MSSKTFPSYSILLIFGLLFLAFNFLPQGKSSPCLSRVNFERSEAKPSSVRSEAQRNFLERRLEPKPRCIFTDIMGNFVSLGSVCLTPPEHQRESGNTTLRDLSGIVRPGRCCPYSEAVCCENGVGCCPRSYRCIRSKRGSDRCRR